MRTIMSSLHSQSATEKPQFTSLEKYFLFRSQPRSIAIDTVATIWFAYYLWHQKLWLAVGILVIARALSWFLIPKPNYQALAETILGKLGLLHLHPVNLFLQSVGVITALVGIWEHSTIFTLCGTSTIIVGHWFGWSKVHPAFESST